MRPCGGHIAVATLFHCKDGDSDALAKSFACGTEMAGNDGVNKKHAYLFTINANFKVLSTCLRMLDKRENDIFILGDRKVFKDRYECGKCLPELENVSVYILEPQIINWGAYSQIDAELKLMEAAINTGIEYTYIHYLQNSDLPIKRHEEIISFFEEKQGNEFVNIVFGWNDRLWRAMYRNFFCQNRWAKSHKFLRALNYWGMKIQKALGLSINDDIRMYIGSALFSITLPCAKYVVNKEKEIKCRFKWSYCGDEIFLPTIIMNSPYRDNLIYMDNGQTSNVVLVDWSKSHRHNSPRLWRGDDFDEIVAKSESYCYARKFIADIEAQCQTSVDNFL